MREQAGNVALEHCRLAIIDPENPRANQPFTDPSKRWTIVYNGEIFNFKEIRCELERQGFQFETNSDTEVVLLGFIHEGERVLKRFRGMFAFIIWDRVTNDIFAARDQIGVKPFYYFIQDDIFAACSEMRPLLAHPQLQPALDPTSVVEFMAFGNNLGERTLINDVKVLPPGHYLSIRGDQVRVAEYWDLLPPTTEGSAEDTAAKDLLMLLDEATAAALVSDVPLGLMLSGGIDSSAVAALAVRHVAARDLTAYSVAFGQADDEVGAAGRLARDLGLPHRVLHATEEHVDSHLDSWLSELDYPTSNPTWLATSLIAAAAHQDGIKVLLSGDGGDELFGGYNRWMKYLAFHDHVWKRARSTGRRLGGRMALRFTRGLASDIARRAAQGGELFVPSRPFHDDALIECLGDVGLAAFAERHPETTILELRQRFNERLPGSDYLSWMSYASLKTSLVEDFLGRLDKMGMRHSVEGRVPLLDPPLARWSLGVPQRIKTPGLRQKELLRAAVTPLLPAYVLERPKQGFCAPIASWSERLMLRRNDASIGALVEEGIVRHDAVEILRSPRHQNSFSSWTLCLLSDWVNRHLARQQLSAAAGAFR
jgi:asparagine synthase (glutamine-hydrolysing)